MSSYLTLNKFLNSTPYKVLYDQAGSLHFPIARLVDATSSLSVPQTHVPFLSPQPQHASQHRPLQAGPFFPRMLPLIGGAHCPTRGLSSNITSTWEPFLTTFHKTGSFLLLFSTLIAPRELITIVNCTIICWFT